MTPRSGKDLACNHLGEIYNNVEHLAFKDELIKAAASILGITVEKFLLGYDKQLSSGVWNKDVPMYSINGKIYSKRTILQYASENVMKPLLGQDAFGKAVARHITDPQKLYLISDGGFEEEVKPILKIADVLFLKRDRLANRWEGDSRGWIPEEVGGTHIWVPDSIGSEQDYLTFIEGVVGWFKDL